MKQLLLAAPLLLLIPVACGGPSSTKGESNIDLGRPALESLAYGRLVDVYAYQRIDPTRPDRADELNRRRVLVQADVVIRDDIGNDELYDAQNQVVPTANYMFLPFDINTGHEELLILWDNTGAEATNFATALSNAQVGLRTIPDSFRGQDTSQLSIPVVPRDAALVLNFSSALGLSSDFFVQNRTAVQLLEFNGDPNVISPADAFRAIPFRTIVRANQIILDPTILGGEASGGFLASGMPASLDQRTANVRIALPSRAQAAAGFFVPRDPNPQLNGLDSQGRDSVIRDFRSANAVDTAQGRALIRDLEEPVILGNVQMGITEVSADGVITINKRGADLPVRGRYPFVGGAIDLNTGLVLGPGTVPTSRPLRSGDFLMQTVQVDLPDGSSEPVRIRAEILWNLDVGTRFDPIAQTVEPGFPGLGLAADGSVNGGAVAHVRVGAIRGTDSLGRPVSFVANGLPLGQDCEIRRVYYENVRFQSGGQAISDSLGLGRLRFLRINPEPPAPGTRVDPNASFALEFSEPMDFESVDATRNLVLANAAMTVANYADEVNIAKRLSASVVPVRWSDQSGDGTILQLQPPMGLYHQSANAELYHFHMLLGSNGIKDLAGNPVQVFNDNPAVQVRNWSVPVTLEQTAEDNFIGWHTYPFEAADEDGTTFGSVDLFGQYRLIDGRLFAADAVRFNRTADSQNLPTINRGNRGECQFVNPPANPPFVPNNGAVLYWTPRMVDTVVPPNVPSVYPDFNIQAQPVGLVVEPHQPRGSRMHMRYLEDDFGLSGRGAGDMMIDVEQLYWSPYADNDVAFDILDRYSMALGHADKRPDEFWFLQTVGAPPNEQDQCVLACSSMNSSLSVNFEDNILRGSTMTTVFEDKVYEMNPGDQFRSSQNVKYIAYPRFDETYTWRDSRLVSVDAGGNVIGLGGARNPQPPNPPTSDLTADVDSPWVPSDMPTPPTASGVFVLDEGDFRGDRRRDHDPIAMPLLVDFQVFPDTIANGGLARGVNAFQVAMLGPPSAFSANPPSPGGYYNLVGSGCLEPDPWPLLRVHTTGGLDPVNRNEILVDPANTTVATGGWLKDAGAIVMGSNFGAEAIHRGPPGDGMLNWASADFVRRVSSVTFGFIDTMKPNQHVDAPVPNGFPDFTFDDTNVLGPMRILDFVSLLDPPLSQQPAGTSIVLEMRGVDNMANADVYDPVVDDTVELRGNLLNPNYACEAYRYSVANSGGGFDTPRTVALGLTPYVTPDRLSLIRNELTGLLPRYINFRLVMTNNIDVTPALSPSLRSMGVVFRMQREN
ncbi:MAG: hypothetical protein AB7O97_10100 [Planctomycetota bacterium]